MKAVLGGRVPEAEDVVVDGALWSEEPRIGLERERASRTAMEGMLFSTRHVRLVRGVSLGMRVRGLPDGWEPPFGQLLKLGGESRLAACREWPGASALGSPRELGSIRQQLLLVALSPVDIEGGVCAGLQPLPELGDVRVVSACLGRRSGWAVGTPDRGAAPFRSGRCSHREASCFARAA